MTWEAENSLAAILGYVILALLILGIFSRFFAGAAALAYFLIVCD